jgi:hypothetical protein
LSTRTAAGAALRACRRLPSRLLPALFPSWRFFDSVGPSPRVDYALTAAGRDIGEADWREFRPRPARVTPARMLLRLFWNPIGNETLYVVRCAERLLEGERGFVELELRRRLARAARRGELGPAAQTAQDLALRVRAVSRRDGRLVEEVVYVAAPPPAKPDTGVRS